MLGVILWFLILYSKGELMW